MLSGDRLLLFSVANALHCPSSRTIYLTFINCHVFTIIIMTCIRPFSVEDGIIRLRSWFASNPDVNPSGAGEQSASSVTRILDCLRDLQNVSSLRPVDRVIMYVGAMMTDALISKNEIEKYSAVLSALAKSVDTQRHVIAAFEWFCGSHKPIFAPKFPLVLKALYDAEIVEEDVFFSWSADYAKNDYSADDSLIGIDTLEELKVSSQPFITWLREADDEEDEDDEEEED